MADDTPHKRAPEPHAYDIESAPVAASAGLHARASTKNFAIISDSKIRRAGLPTHDDNGRRNILTTDFWGWRLASTPDTIAESLIERFPAHMREEIRAQRREWRGEIPQGPMLRGHNLHANPSTDGNRRAS